jgi:hypothetical protein
VCELGEGQNRAAIGGYREPWWSSMHRRFWRGGRSKNAERQISHCPQHVMPDRAHLDGVLGMELGDE